MAGCTTTTPQESPATPIDSPTVSPPSAEETPSPSARPQQVWKDALDRTREADASTIEAQLITNVEGFERILSGIGYVEMAQRYGDIVWTDDLGVSREVITSTGHFLELDGSWFEIDGLGGLPTTVAFDPLAGLNDATDVVDAGVEDVGDEPTVRLDADLDPVAARGTMGFSEEETTVFAEGADASLIATIWIDADGMIVRILREYRSTSIDGDPISATSLFLLTDVGQYRPIDVPETSEAIPAPV